MQEGNILLPKASSGNIRMHSSSDEHEDGQLAPQNNSLNAFNPMDPRLVLIDFEYASYNYRLIFVFEKKEYELAISEGLILPIILWNTASITMWTNRPIMRYSRRGSPPRNKCSNSCIAMKKSCMRPNPKSN
jgi:hypothetical protein